MVLDNESQRQMLMTILQNTPLQGNLRQVREATKQLEGLILAVETAEIKDKSSDTAKKKTNTN